MPYAALCLLRGLSNPVLTSVSNAPPQYFSLSLSSFVAFCGFTTNCSCRCFWLHVMFCLCSFLHEGNNTVVFFGWLLWVCIRFSHLYSDLDKLLSNGCAPFFGQKVIRTKNQRTKRETPRCKHIKLKLTNQDQRTKPWKTWRKYHKSQQLYYIILTSTSHLQLVLLIFSFQTKLLLYAQVAFMASASRCLTSSGTVCAPCSAAVPAAAAARESSQTFWCGNKCRSKASEAWKQKKVWDFWGDVVCQREMKLKLLLLLLEGTFGPKSFRKQKMSGDVITCMV